MDLLATALGQAIRELMGDAVFMTVEDLREHLIAAARDGVQRPADTASETIRALDTDRIADVVKCFTSYFRLVNAAERFEIERVNRVRSHRSEIERPDSLAAAIDTLAAQGHGFEKISELLDRLDIQPTLTAHPTEARRLTIVSLESAITTTLHTLRRPDATAAEVADAEQKIQALVRVLLSTDEVSNQRRSVDDEIRLGLHFLASSIWEAVPRIHRDLRRAMKRHFGRAPTTAPFLRYRSWIGGDRDGNPNVTPQVTRRELDAQRVMAVQLHLQSMQEIRRELSSSERIARIPDGFMESLRLDEQHDPLPGPLRALHQNEPFRLKATHIIQKLQRTISGGAYRPTDFVRDLTVLYDATVHTLGETFREGRLRDALVRARTFGFHLAAIDIREHSAVHAAAVAELLAATGREHAYANLDESERQRLLEREIEDPTPRTPDHERLGSRTRRLLETFEVVRDAMGRDPTSVGAWIISMTHAPSAVLEVLYLAKYTGLWHVQNQGAGCPLDIVPLIETIDDLRAADGLLDALFSLPAYQKHLAGRGKFQEVMLGYSDSNKDGGYWAANASLYDAQKRVARACERHGLRHRLFHGRGGTVGRGGGRANRAIMSLPPETRSGRIRFTEQGEVISFRYASEDLAHRHIEQVVSATMLTAANPTQNSAPDGAEEMLERLARASRKAYRALIDDPGFWPWYRLATPIDHIGELRIGSRPVSRSRGDLQFEDMRAIPWNFAWTQTRYCVPGWYGLQVVRTDESAPTEHELRDLWRDWDYFRSIADNCELEMARTRLDTAWRYDVLSPDSFHQRIADAFGDARDVLLEITRHWSLLEDEPVISESIELRNPYTDALNMLQVELLRRAREGDTSASLEAAILLSINGVAAAMQSTG